MSHRSALRPLLAATLGLALLAGCQPPASTPGSPTSTTTSTTSTESSAPAGQPSASPSVQAAQPIGLFGRAEIDGVPFANAEVKIFKPGETTPIATATTDAAGKFTILTGSWISNNSGNVISTGGGNVISTGGGNVISTGGGNVISTGGGNVISTGGGNVISTGGGNWISNNSGNVISTGGGNVISTGGLNLVAPGAPLKVVASKEGQSLSSVGLAGVISTGGGNWISNNSGNVISTGGGNVISTGGLNYQTLANENQEVVVSLGTTLAVKLLKDRLDGVGRALVRGNGTVIADLVDRYVVAFNALAKSGDEVIPKAPNKQALITMLTRPEPVTFSQIRSTLGAATIRLITTAAATAAEEMAKLIREGVTQGGSAPTPAQNQGMSFGDAQVPPVTGSGTTAGGSGGGGTGGGTGGGAPNGAAGAPIAVDGNFNVPGTANNVNVVNAGDILWDSTLPSGTDTSVPFLMNENDVIDFTAPTGVVMDMAFYDMLRLEMRVDNQSPLDTSVRNTTLEIEVLDANGDPFASGMVETVTPQTGDAMDSWDLYGWNLASDGNKPLVRGVRITCKDPSGIKLELPRVYFDYFAP